jgi:hypothetical protein
MRSLTSAADGTLYAPYDYNGSERGVMRIDPARKSCEIVSESSSKPKGAGPENSTFRSVFAHQGSVLATDFIKNALFKIDVKSGDRTILSSSKGGGTVGAGPKALGTGYMTAEGNTLWVSGPVVGNDASPQAPGVVEVDLATGSRKTFKPADGPMMPSDQPLPIWKEKGSRTLLVAVDNGILRYELDGDRNWISVSPD